MVDRIKPIAIRIATYEKILDEADPDYVKILNILGLKTKNTLKDLIDAVRNEDEASIIYMIHIIMEQFEDIFKYMNLRPFKNKFKNLVDKEFLD